jgi:hypothetical protein
LPVISLEGPRCSGVKEEAALVDVMFSSFRVREVSQTDATPKTLESVLGSPLVFAIGM